MQKEQDHKNLLTTDQAAAYLTSGSGLNIRSVTLSGWRMNKKGPNYHKIGGLVGYAVVDLDAFLRDTLIEVERKPCRVMPARRSNQSSSAVG